MNKLIKGITYSFNRNLGWKDRVMRAILGIGFGIGAVYLYQSNFILSVLLGISSVSLFATVFSARCMICYFSGRCTIGNNEKRNLDTKGIAYEK